MLKLLIICLSVTTSVASTASSYTPAEIRAAIKQAGGPEKFLAVIGSNTAKSSGQMLDSQTQLIGSAANGKTIIYYMRSVNFDKKDIPELSAMRRTIASKNAPMVCSAPVASILIQEFGAEYKYIIYSKSREYLFDYSIKKLTCLHSYNW